MLVLLDVLKECCVRHPGELCRAQALMDVDNSATVDAFRRGRSSNSVMHKMLVQLFTLQVEHGFWLSIHWVPSAANHAVDTITLPGLHEIIRLHQEVFDELLLLFFDLFTVDLMASSENAQRVCALASGDREQLPFFSRYHCEGSAWVDAFRQNVATTPGLGTKAFGYCFSRQVMAGHVVQRLAECQAHAVLVLPDVQDYWSPRVHHVTTRTLRLPRAGTFESPHHHYGLREYTNVRHMGCAQSNWILVCILRHDLPVCTTVSATTFIHTQRLVYDESSCCRSKIAS